MQIDFSAAFVCISQSGLLYKLRDAEIGSAVFDIISDFSSGNVHSVLVDDIRSENVRIVSGFPQDSILGTLLFLL